MIFNNLEDFSIDLTDKVLSFVTDSNYDQSNILPILKSYLHETKNIGEIDDFTISYINEQFELTISKNNTDKSFNIKIENEIRKRKLKQLKRDSFSN